MKNVLVGERMGTITTVAGTASVTIDTTQCILEKIWIKPTTASTIYDFTLTDYHDLETFVEKDIDGTYSETDVGEPIYQNFTLTIENASNDEEFTYLLAFRH